MHTPGGVHGEVRQGEQYFVLDNRRQSDPSVALQRFVAGRKLRPPRRFTAIRKREFQLGGQLEIEWIEAALAGQVRRQTGASVHPRHSGGRHPETQHDLHHAGTIAHEGGDPRQFGNGNGAVHAGLLAGEPERVHELGQWAKHGARILFWGPDHVKARTATLRRAPGRAEDRGRGIGYPFGEGRTGELGRDGETKEGSKVE